MRMKPEALCTCSRKPVDQDEVSLRTVLCNRSFPKFRSTQSFHIGMLISMKLEALLAHGLWWITARSDFVRLYAIGRFRDSAFHHYPVRHIFQVVIDNRARRENPSTYLWSDALDVDSRTIAKARRALNYCSLDPDGIFRIRRAFFELNISFPVLDINHDASANKSFPVLDINHDTSACRGITLFNY
ncbi:hypothetical protein PCANC_17335 [Puccinia coronata f. sp. avenae]|uniref:Uncharacterized protein n=1 Tax=Puccinia coronata f. sp. avenae TaxID=200324 RepID=A0A2N5UH07_9BASI|nr:hypothetical protein PCANC_16242 [Puccinia coronata f. sp. avenae]PLW37035.1 hypothetical protein PCASD_16348 [Puccinia coronata f. sp. avenae]PLW41329.1 hypothetical protein PCANC_17335 [Puccinia coronata f. sp. avenae]